MYWNGIKLNTWWKAEEININMRCIEMRAGATEPAKPSRLTLTWDVLKCLPDTFIPMNQYTININMRCIEIELTHIENGDYDD